MSSAQPPVTPSAPGSSGAVAPADPPPDGPLSLIGGVVVWTVLCALIALVEVVLLPWTTSGSVHIPASMVIAVVANLLLPRVFVRGLGLRHGWLIPLVVWFAIILTSASRTADSDLLIVSSDFSGTYNTIFLALGGISAAIGAVTANRPLPGRRKESTQSDH